MEVIYCEYDEATGHKGCKNFPCVLCDVEDEKEMLKELLNNIKGE